MTKYTFLFPAILFLAFALVSCGSNYKSPANLTSPTGTVAITVDPSGKYVYVTNNALSNTVSQYTIGAEGALAVISPATVATGAYPDGIAVANTPSGKYVYVANAGISNTLTQYTIGADGALTALAPPAVATGGGPTSVTVDPSGMYVYVANLTDSTVSQFTIGANGALTPMTPATVAAGTGPVSVTVANTPSGEYVYVANAGNTTLGQNVSPSISQYTIGAGGALIPMTPATVATGSFPESVTVDPSGKYVYVANFGAEPNDGTISQYTIGANGALTAISTPTVTAGVGPVSVAVANSPSGEYVYVANFDSNTISQYAIGANGALTAISTPIATGPYPDSVSVDPSGMYVYVSNFYSLTISQYTIGANGALTAQ